MEVAGADSRWTIGFEAECWWSRVALPTLSSWTEEGKPERLVQRSVPKEDSEPKAISCYGLYLPELHDTWLRFVDGRPVSSITTRFLSWCCEKLEAAGKKVLLLIWDNASGHVSKEVRRWLGKHNRRVKNSGEGVRIVSCLLPKQSPWLNAIEPKWIPRQAQGRRARRSAWSLRTRRQSMLGFRLPSLRASVHSPEGRLIMH